MTALRTLAIAVLAAFIAGYAVLWAGGALEFLADEPLPDGPGCYTELTAGDSAAALGTEADEWIGGGVLGRPGRVCVLEPADVVSYPPEMVPPDMARDLATNGSASLPVFTGLDLLSALGAVVVSMVVFVAVILRASFRAKRNAGSTATQVTAAAGPPPSSRR